MTKRDLALLVCAAVIPFGVAVHGCGGGSSGGGGGGDVQVERLGRPAIGEGLLIDNEFLIAFNSIPPDQDLTVYTTNTEFRNQVRAVMNAVDDAVAPVDNVDQADIEQAFFPDVMRIDTSLAVPVGTQAYGFGALTVGTTVRPIAGRKLEDDVIDTTLFVLAGGAGLTDNVDYRDATLNDGAGQVDHDLLEGQAAPNGAATFPFLAPAN